MEEGGGGVESMPQKSTDCLREKGDEKHLPRRPAAKEGEKGENIYLYYTVPILFSIYCSTYIQLYSYTL